MGKVKTGKVRVKAGGKKGDRCKKKSGPLVVQDRRENWGDGQGRKERTIEQEISTRM